MFTPVFAGYNEHACERGCHAPPWHSHAMGAGMHFAPELMRSGQQPKVAWQRVHVVRRAPKSEVRFTLLYKHGVSIGLRTGLASAPPSPPSGGSWHALRT